MEWVPRKCVVPRGSFKVFKLGIVRVNLYIIITLVFAPPKRLEFGATD
jgi:hypothetical protein